MSRSPSRRRCCSPRCAPAHDDRRPHPRLVARSPGAGGCALQRGTGSIAAEAATPDDARLLRLRPAIRCSWSAGSSPTAPGDGSRRPSRGTRRSLRDRRRVRGRGPDTTEPIHVHMSDRRPAGHLVLEDRSEAGRVVVEDASNPSGMRGTPARRRPRMRCPTSPRASSMSTCTAGAATMRWATSPPSTGWLAQLLRRGVTSFLPTGVTAPLDPVEFADRVRSWIPARPGRRRGAARVQPRGTVAVAPDSAVPTTRVPA